MAFTDWLKKALEFVEHRQNALFSLDVKKQEKILASFPEPKDDIERSYFQYRCQTKGKNVLINAFINVASLPVSLFYWTKLSHKPPVEKVDVPYGAFAVFFRDGKPSNILPHVLENEFEHIYCDPEDSSLLLKKDAAFLKELLKRYPFSWHFFLKTLLKTARYRYAIARYAPTAIIACNEYSFTSSAVTAFCEREGIRHINVMHGEKLFYQRDSFFRFHKCYVWDEHYVTLFTDMRAAPDQFEIAVPPSLRFENAPENPEKTVRYTYYLADEDREQLEVISDMMLRLKEKGNVISIRPHPRFTDPALATEFFEKKGLPLEIPAELSIEKSLLRTENAVSRYSTVLTQAYMNNVRVIIDDVSAPDRYRKLVDLRYHLVSVNPRLLSEEVASLEKEVVS